jgi:itaconate CoA-transferase
VLLDPSLATDARFNSNTKRHEGRTALKAIIDACFQTLSITEVEARLDDAKIANARMNEMKDVWDHPQLGARHRWQYVESPVGDVPALLPPGVNNEYTYRMDAIPAVGQHTETILKELGLSASVIAEMKQVGAI